MITEQQSAFLREIGAAADGGSGRGVEAPVAIQSKAKSENTRGRDQAPRVS